MKKDRVERVTVAPPIRVIGRHFFGDYSNSQGFIEEVQGLLTKEGIGFTPHKVFGIYYDNPQTTPPEELRCFQGVFPIGDLSDPEPPLEAFLLKGTFLHVRVQGDPMKSVFEGYSALFDHIKRNDVILRSNAGHQIAAFEDNIVTTDIYMELGD